MSYWKQIQVADVTGDVAEVTPYGELHTVTPIRLCGGGFNDGVLDTSFFSTTNTNGGTATVANSVLTVATNTTANGASEVMTKQAGRFVGGTSNRFYGRILLSDTGVVNNVRRWGLLGPAGTNGIYFKLSGTTLSVNLLKGGVETSVTVTPSITLTNLNFYKIDYNSGVIYFVINNVIISTVTPTAPYIDNLQLFAFADSTNSAGSTTNATINAMQLSIYRLGSYITQPIAGRITTPATTILKYGPGLLHRITLNNPSGTLLTVYDNTAGSGTTIAIINTPAQANPVTLEFGTTFQTGLTVVSTGTWDATIIFE